VGINPFFLFVFGGSLQVHGSFLRGLGAGFKSFLFCFWGMGEACWALSTFNKKFTN
jgi:hypothetical protein